LQATLALPKALVLSRGSLDAGLVQAAVRSGAQFLSQTYATCGVARPLFREIVLRQRERCVRATAKVVLAADGLGGRLVCGKKGPLVSSAAKSWIGLGAIAPDGPSFYGSGTIYMACGSGGYAGIVRLEDGRLNVAAAVDPAMLKQAGHAGSAVAALLGEVGLPLVSGLAKSHWCGTAALTRRTARLGHHRLFVIGDAAGYIEPFTGEGIAWALAAGQAVAPLAMQAVHHWRSHLALKWSTVYHKTVGRRQRVCRALTTVVRRPFLIGAVVAALAWVPSLAQPFIHELNRSA
jgi:flavin-dependent dehydrogenase